jgi:hypothetical protein
MELRAAFLAGILFFVATSVYGESVMQLNDGDVQIVLHDTPCKLKEVVNLPRKAVWMEKGKTFEGCWGVRPDVGVVVFYFDDKTVGLAPMQAFKRITPI